jgi:hypothetical protein
MFQSKTDLDDFHLNFLNKMYLYVASCPQYLASNLYKLGFTSEPYGRLSTYATGFPPEPQYKFEYYGLWQTNAKNIKELIQHEKILHDKFDEYRMGTSEWFKFQDSALESINNFMDKCKFVLDKVNLNEISKPKKIPSESVDINNIQNFCLERGIKTSKEYEELRKEIHKMPENPNGTMTWFDFLNPNENKIALKTFLEAVVYSGKRDPFDYANWYDQMNYPSLQNIRDGYFGKESTDFLEMIEQFSPTERRRR